MRTRDEVCPRCGCDRHDSRDAGGSYHSLQTCANRLLTQRDEALARAANTEKLFAEWAKGSRSEKLAAENSTLRAELARVMLVIEHLEWGGHRFGDKWCGYCGERPASGHAASCIVAAALADSPKAGGPEPKHNWSKSEGGFQLCAKCGARFGYDDLSGASKPCLGTPPREPDPSAAELLRHGGDWLGAARNWIKWHRKNGECVTWSSRDVLEPPMTVADVEDLASEVAAAALRSSR